MTDYSRLSALEAACRIANGELTAETLVRACLERIAEREPMIGAWTHLDGEQAIAEAQKRDHGPTRGPLQVCRWA